MVYKIFYIHCLEILKSPNPTRRQALSPPTVYVRYHTASTVMQVMEVIGRSSERTPDYPYTKLDLASQGGQV